MQPYINTLNYDHDHEHDSGTITYTKDDTADTVTDGDKAKGLGYSKFTSHVRPSQGHYHLSVSQR